MATSMEKPVAVSFQGIEYFWDAIKLQGQNRHEAALALLHWILVGNGYRCIGRDNQFPAARDESKLGSEKLPESWNDRSAGFYSLLYVHPNRPSNMYLIKLIPVGSTNDGAIVGQVLVFTAAEDVISFELDSHKFIPEDWKTTSSPTEFSEFKAFTEFVEKDILLKIRPKRVAQGVSSDSRDDGRGFTSSTFIGQAQPPPSRHIPFVPDIGPPPLREFVPPGGNRNPFALGSRDLDPFSGMGGNIMGPGTFQPGGFPGAGGMGGGLIRPYRYDPILPPDAGFPGGGGGFGGPWQPPRGDPLGMFPGRGNPLGASVVGIPGMGMGGVPRRAPLQPGEPDPDHERPPPNPGDDLDNMFM
ncbi:hypothetical protein BV898_00811 [Hypsibius exemplaris]|uniref:Proteasome inhibitor PI31 subunit n=1 Tax=Hypsibius exemplaris TaxID=2072580 RepID=A0A1W0XC89_HYPEX|nr:hypothetical protein BV898_00811 [Hypsibius exemplaris]